MAREIVYLTILSRVSEKLDRMGIHRVHALGLEQRGRGVLVMLPSGGGKSAPFLTWPEGNGRLVAHLQRDYGDRVETGRLVTEVEPERRRVMLRVVDIRTATETRIHADHVILAVPHRPYLELDPNQVVEWAGGPLAVIDCFGILTDERTRRYFELGCEVKALGRGHIQRIKEDVRKSRTA